MTIQEAVETVQRAYPLPQPGQSADTLKFGDWGRPLTGIASVFMPTMDVLAKAVGLKANLVISHEPLFYHKDDEPEFLRGDVLCRDKRDFLQKHNLVVWRFHDAPHMASPDLYAEGIMHRLAWHSYASGDSIPYYTIPEMRLGDLADFLKQRLEVGALRVTGDPDLFCRKVGIRVGSPGGAVQMRMLRELDLDVLITGECLEWETCEYVRDSAKSSRPRGLILLGHANSEEPGVEWVTAKIRALLSEAVPVHYIRTGDPFSFR